MPQTSDGDSNAGGSEETFEFDPTSGKAGSDAGSPQAGDTSQHKADNSGETQTSNEAQTNQNETDNADENKSTESQPSQEDKPVSQGKVHHEALALIGAYLDGDPDKAKQFFAEHPEIAAKANQSKSYKDKYRELIGAKSETKAEESTESKPTEQTKETESAKGGEKETEESTDEKTLEERIYAKNLERGIKAERKVEAEKFAIKNGMNADNLDALHQSAEAMHTTNPNLSYEQCLQGAKVAIEGSQKKDTTVNMPSSSGGQSEGSEKSGNEESEVKRIMKEYNYPEGKARKYVESQSGKKYDGERGVWIGM